MWLYLATSLAIKVYMYITSFYSKRYIEYQDRKGMVLTLHATMRLVMLCLGLSIGAFITQMFILRRIFMSVKSDLFWHDYYQPHTKILKIHTMRKTIKINYEWP